MRCATVFSEKLRLLRRTAASSKDEALYTKGSDLSSFAQKGLKIFSVTLLSPRHNEQELAVDITIVQFSASLLSSLSKVTDSVQT